VNTFSKLSRVNHQRGRKRALGLLVVPALLFLSACAGTRSLPAPVVDLSQPAKPGESTLNRPNSTPVNSNDEPGAGDGVIVSALSEPPPATDVTPIDQVTVPADSMISTPLDPPREMNPAVVSLLNRANRDQRNGDSARAAANIERALKIEPDNAWLWHRLALARFAQGQVGQAAALAAKSNTLVAANPGNRALMAKNWLLIARVHTQRGENIAAKAATDRARRIQSGSS